MDSVTTEREDTQRETRGCMHKESRAASEHARHTLCVVPLCVAVPRCMYE